MAISKSPVIFTCAVWLHGRQVILIHWGDQRRAVLLGKPGICPHIYCFYEKSLHNSSMGMSNFCQPRTPLQAALHGLFHVTHHAHHAARMWKWLRCKIQNSKQREEREREEIYRGKWSVYTKAGHRKRRRGTKGRSLFQSCQSYRAFIQEPRNKSSRLHRLLSPVTLQLNPSPMTSVGARYSKR